MIDPLPDPLTLAPDMLPLMTEVQLKVVSPLPGSKVGVKFKDAPLQIVSAKEAAPLVITGVGLTVTVTS